MFSWSSPPPLSLCQNGSYVLPMSWLGSPLKLSCPAQIASPAPSFSPSVFCSSYGMAVQMEGKEPDVTGLGVLGVLDLLRAVVSETY